MRSTRAFLLDTSALIHFLSGTSPYIDVLVPLMQRVQQRQATLVISAVSEAELLVRPFDRQDDEAQERISDLLSEEGIRVVGIDRFIARRAARLRAMHRPLRLPDAMIVATALESGCDLVVGNDGEWSKLRDVPFVRLDDIIK